jgi:hypothetical protein
MLQLAAPGTPAPPWAMASWLHADAAPTVESMRGKVIVAHAFQMLCPGCVQYALPQMMKVRELFDEREVAVVGLHTVFEHHEAMTPVSLRAFAHEYRLDVPIGIDAHESGVALPVTMRRYGMRGTPTLLLIDRRGDLRLHAFGAVDDMALGAAIATLIAG